MLPKLRHTRRLKVSSHPLVRAHAVRIGAGRALCLCKLLVESEANADSVAAELVETHHTSNSTAR